MQLTARTLALFASVALSILFAGLALGGCASPPRVNPVEQTADSISTATMGTSKLTKVYRDDGKLTLNVDTSLPTYASLLDFTTAKVTGTDGKPVEVILPRLDSTGGGASHEMLFPLGHNRFAGLRSSTVMSVEADKYESRPDGSIVIDGLRVGSNAAESNRSVAEAAKALAPTWAAWSADQRASYETYVKEQAALGRAGFEALAKAIDLLKSLRPTP